MSVRIETTYGALQIGDYIVSRKDGVVWKVTHKREDGWLGILHANGERKKLSPDLADRAVTQIVYGFDSLEDMQAAAEQTVKDTLGGTVLHRTEGPKWVMPSLAEIYADAIQLKAHLLVHHEVLDPLNHDLQAGDLAVIHNAEHAKTGTDAPTHTHEEN